MTEKLKLDFGHCIFPAIIETVKKCATI